MHPAARIERENGDLRQSPAVHANERVNGFW